MTVTHSDTKSARRRVATVCAGGAAALLVSCGTSSKPASPTHLATIQTAITCPAPPLHTALIDPTRTFTVPPKSVIGRDVGYCAYIATTRGTISVRLRPEYAPKAVNDFVTLADHGFYDGLTFYQVCPDAAGPPCPSNVTAAITGDPTGTGNGGPGYTVTPDPVIGQYLFGAVAMYGGSGSTVGSQFFISRGDDTGLPRKYDIFGQVTDGIPALATLQKGDTVLWIAVEQTAPEP